MAAFHVSVVLACGQEQGGHCRELPFANGHDFVVDVAFGGGVGHAHEPDVKQGIAGGEIHVDVGDGFQRFHDVVVIDGGFVEGLPEVFEMKCQQGVEEAALVAEVMVERGLAYTCGVCDFLHAGSVVAFAAEEDQGLL